MLELAKADMAKLPQKSLVIFNMDWKICDIDAQVSRASRSLNAIVESMGLRGQIHFDMASPGAGEFINAIRGRKPIMPETLDFLRQEHARVRQELTSNPAYTASRDAAEMLRKLRGQGRTLAVIYNGASQACDMELRRARLRDFFEEQVFGCDNSASQKFDAGLYGAILEANHVYPHQAVIIEETPEGAAYGSQTRANVAAYISLQNCRDDEFKERQVAMRRAGVKYVVTTTSDIADLPGRISTREEMYAKFFPNLN